MPLQDGDEREIIQLLQSLHLQDCALTFPWCPSHSGVIGNEQADKKAEGGTEEDQKGRSWQYAAAKAVIH